MKIIYRLLSFVCVLWVVSVYVGTASAHFDAKRSTQAPPPIIFNNNNGNAQYLCWNRETALLLCEEVKVCCKWVLYDYRGAIMVEPTVVPTLEGTNK